MRWWSSRCWRQRVTRYDLKLRRWPAELPLTVAVISDLHACKPWMEIERIQSIVEQTNELNADVIVLLGDFVAGLRYYRTGLVGADEWAKALTGLKAPLGVHAILGNHDWWEDRAAQANGHGPTFSRLALERAGIPVYENDVVRLTKSGRHFWLAGLGDQLAFQATRRRYPGRRIGVDDLDRHACARCPTAIPSSCSRTSPTSCRACPSGCRWCSAAIPMAARCGCSAGRRWFPRATATATPMATCASNVI